MSRGGRLSVPDALALSRMLMTVPIMMMVRADHIDGYLWWAGLMFLVAALTDLVDGYLARRSTGGTTLGAFLDTTADKILVTGTLLALVSVDHVSIWPASIIIFREFVVMALRGVVAQRGGLIAPSTWGKAKAFTQYVAILSAFVRLPERWGPLYLDQYLMMIAVVVTIGSLWGYLTGFWDTIRSEPSESRAG